MLYAGIDLGTSSVKLLLCDEKGVVINTVTKEYPLSLPREGWAEQDPADWYGKTVEGLIELVAGRGGELRGLSFGGQMHGLVMLDENGETLRPAILWNDGRSTEECDWLNNSVGREKLAEWTGNIAFTGFTAPKILWVKKHESELFARCKRIMLPKDYLCLRLCGEFVTDPSDASGTLLYDVKNGRWSPEMLELCGITEAMLPAVRCSYEPVGLLKKEIAKLLGAGDVIVASGAGDNAAAAVGMGVVGSGKCSVSVGTSGTVFITSDSFFATGGEAVHSFAHADGGFHLLGCVLSAAGCNKWWTEDILGSADYTAEQEGITSLGDNGVFFLPYLMGERSPHNDAFARGVFAGMSLDSSRSDMTQAVMEGVAFALRDCIEASGLDISEACLCGGGAKSPLWRRILANVLRMRLRVPVCAEGPAYGAALLAMTAAGEYPSVRDAAEATVKMGEPVCYDTETAAKYDRAYKRWRGLYKALRSWFREL